ncbi:hypothetical protein N0V90_001805 [Kalmusia sp. IMI 367209]|nr:hypothetical protein N0V90_001805 [Kalmusia sp. IMI 367209]
MTLENMSMQDLPKEAAHTRNSHKKAFGPMLLIPRRPPDRAMERLERVLQEEIRDKLKGLIYLGTSSNWSFHGQVLNIVHQHIRSTPLPGAELLFDGSAYNLPWDGSRSLPETTAPVIPSIDYAIFLINAVKFHCGQLVHLFDEEEFMGKLHAFYSNTDQNKLNDSLCENIENLSHLVPISLYMRSNCCQTPIDCVENLSLQLKYYAA